MQAKDLKIAEFALLDNSINKSIIKKLKVGFVNITENYYLSYEEGRNLEVEKLKNVKITYDGDRLEYPKIMIVAHHSDFRYPFNKKNVIGRFQGLNIVKDINTEGYSEYSVWAYAKDLEPKKELIHLTLQDISDGRGVGVNPELIRIKKQ